MAKTYDQYCPVAVALDVIGERWSLLILRDLLEGPKRYTDLQRGLPGIGPNLLADRLRDLQDAGVVEKRELPPPAARTVFALTRDGRALEPVFIALTRWGVKRLPEIDDGDVVDAPTALMSGLIAYAELADPDAEPRHWTVRVGRYTLGRRRGRVRFEAAPAEDPDVVGVLDPNEIMRLRQGIEHGEVMEFEAGTDEAIDEFREIFQLARVR